MSRLIDANQIVYSWQIDADGQEHDGVTLKSIIDKMPTMEPEPQWIPCSERLPEIGKEVLLSDPNTIFIAEYHGSGDPVGLWIVEGYHHYLADVNGCAWMPLPEPWKGDKE